MENIGREISNYLDDDFSEKFLVIKMYDDTYNSVFINVVDGELVNSNSDELDKIDEIDFFDILNEPGIYIFRFQNKENIECKFIKKEEIELFNDNNIEYITLYELYKLYPQKTEKKEYIEKYINYINNKDDNKEYFYDNKKININSGNVIENLTHISSDYNFLISINLEEIVKNKLIPWIIGDKSLDVDKIYEGIKLDSINYSYSKIIEKYSPTKQTDYFGCFSVQFISDSEYTNKLLEVVEMQLYIKNNEIVDIKCYDV